MIGIIENLDFMAFVTMFFPAVKMSVEGIISNNTEVSGLQALFGGKIIEENQFIQLTVFQLRFNPVAFIGYLLPFLSIVVSFIAFKVKGMLAHFIAAILCIIGAVLIFLEPTFFATINEINENITCSLLIGPILGGIFAILAGMVNAGSSLLKK